MLSGVDSTETPPVTPDAVTIYGRSASCEGIVKVNCAGREVTTLLTSRGSSPTTPTAEKEEPLGDDTEKLTAWPGLTTVPSAGELIWSDGCVCGKAKTETARRAAKMVRRMKRIEKRIKINPFRPSEFQQRQPTSFFFLSKEARPK